jgi:hypothetical protein
MVETIGTVMIAAAIAILLMLISLAYKAGGAERQPAVDEAIIAGVAALLAIGLGLAEFGTSRSEGEPYRLIVAGRFGMVGGALALIWLWVRLCHNRRGRVSP